MSKVVQLKPRSRPTEVDLDALRVGAPTLASDHQPAPPIRERRACVQDPFVLVTIKELERGVAACGGQQLAVWLYIVRQARLRGTRTVRVTSKGLTAFGVDPDAKLRALRRLEEAELITVGRQDGRNPVVTIVPVG